MKLSKITTRKHTRAVKMLFQYFFMVGWSDKHNKIATFRVDRIYHVPEILPEVIVKKPKDYRVEKYTQEVFRMFSTDETVDVRLLCDNDVMKFVIDQFGLKVHIKTETEDQFRANVRVCPGPTFFGWVFGFGGKIVIIGPEEIRKEYMDRLQIEAKRYSG